MQPGRRDRLDPKEQPRRCKGRSEPLAQLAPQGHKDRQARKGRLGCLRQSLGHRVRQDRQDPLARLGRRGKLELQDLLVLPVPKGHRAFPALRGQQDHKARLATPARKGLQVQVAQQAHRDLQDRRGHRDRLELPIMSGSELPMTL